jgi:hypothetical protein
MNSNSNSGNSGNTTKATYKPSHPNVSNTTSTMAAYGNENAYIGPNPETILKIQNEVMRLVGVVNDATKAYQADKTQENQEDIMLATIDLYEYLVTVPSYLKANRAMAARFYERTQSVLSKDVKKGSPMFGLYQAYKVYAALYARL